MKTHFKENRLLFKDTEKPEPAAEPAADKPKEVVADTMTVEQVKAEVQNKLDELRAKALAVKHGERSKDQAIEAECEILIGKIAQLEEELKVVIETKKLPKGIKDADAYETKLKEQLAQFNKELSVLIERKKAADEVAIGLTETNEKQKALAAKAYKIMQDARIPAPPPEATDADAPSTTEEDLKFSEEDLQNVLGHYASGKYDIPVEKGNTTAVMVALAYHAEDLKAAGIHIGYMGGTDGTDHQMNKKQEYHEHKAHALEQLLVFHDAGKLNLLPAGSIDLTPDPKSPTRALIEQYIETAADKRYAFVKEHKAEFLPGGKIFDAALAVERADDRKQHFISGPEKDLNPETNRLTIELGTDKNTKEQRKSGIFLYEGKEKVVDKGEFDYEIGEDGTELIIKPIEKPEGSDKLPPPFSYQLIPSVKEGAVFDLKVDEKTKVPSVSVVIGDDAIIGLELDRKTGEPTKEIPGDSGYTLKITPHNDNEPGKIEIRQLEKTNTPDTTGQLKEDEHPNDTSEEKAARAYYKGKNIPYMTEAEALNAETIEEKDGGIHVKDGYDWVVKNDDVKTNHKNHQNYATKKIEDSPAVPAPDAPTPSTPEAPTPPAAPEALPADTADEAAERAACATSKTPYKTQAEALRDSSVKRVPQDGKPDAIFPARDDEEYVTADETRTNYATQKKLLYIKDDKLTVNSKNGEAQTYDFIIPSDTGVEYEVSSRGTGANVVLISINGYSACSVDFISPQVPAIRVAAGEEYTVVIEKPASGKTGKIEIKYEKKSDAKIIAELAKRSGWEAKKTRGWEAGYEHSGRFARKQQKDGTYKYLIDRDGIEEYKELKPEAAAPAPAAPTPTAAPEAPKPAAPKPVDQPSVPAPAAPTATVAEDKEYVETIKNPDKILALLKKPEDLIKFVEKFEKKEFVDALVKVLEDTNQQQKLIEEYSEPENIKKFIEFFGDKEKINSLISKFSDASVKRRIETAIGKIENEVVKRRAKLVMDSMQTAIDLAENPGQIFSKLGEIEDRATRLNSEMGDGPKAKAFKRLMKNKIKESDYYKGQADFVKGIIDAKLDKWFPSD